MDPGLQTCSGSWSNQHDLDEDILMDYYNTAALATHTPSTTPLSGYPYLPDEAYRQLLRLPADIDETALSQPQPSLVHRDTFMLSDQSWRRASSPTLSGSSIGTSTISGAFSDRYDTPRSSPEIINQRYPGSSSVLPNGVSYTCGGFSPKSCYESHASVACVAMNEVQAQADERTETPTMDLSEDTHAWHRHGAFGPYGAEDGYQPMVEEHTPDQYLNTPNGSEYQTQGTSRHPSEGIEQKPVTIRRRRAPSAAAFRGFQTSSGRISKRPQQKRRGLSFRSDKSRYDFAEPPEPGMKDFPCPFIIYGCSSTFGNKNEWKRHVQTQHMRLSYWRCDQCIQMSGSRTPNDFNRRDLFIQHVRRMHPFYPSASRGEHNRTSAAKATSPDEEEYLADEATRCHRQLRQPPTASRCVLCGQHFRGSNSWDQRMEHMGRHFGTRKKSSSRGSSSSSSDAALPEPQAWHVDYDLEQYLLGEGILANPGRRLGLADSS